MGRNSKWIETELERGDEVCLVPLRSRLEARRNRLRTVIQRLENGQWVTVYRSAWTKSPRAQHTHPDAMDKAAEEVADALISQVEQLL